MVEQKLRIALLGLVGWGFTFPVVASPVIRAPVDSSEVKRIGLHRDGSLTLDWTQTDRVVETVFLSNPSFVMLGSDGCLAGLNGSTCRRSRASVLNIRLNRTATSGRSTLTVVTVAASGSRITQVYDLRRSGSSDREISLIQYYTPPPSFLASTSPYSPAVRLKKGLSLAQSRKLLTDPLLISKSRMLVSYVEQGAALADAAIRAGVSIPYAQRLLEMGGESN